MKEVDNTLEIRILKQQNEKLENEIEKIKANALRAYTHFKNGQYESAEFVLASIIGIRRQEQAGLKIYSANEDDGCA